MISGHGYTWGGYQRSGYVYAEHCYEHHAANREVAGCAGHSEVMVYHKG